MRSSLTAQPSTATTKSPLGRWLQRGRRRTPWLHGLAAFAVGFVLYAALQQAIVALLFGMPWLVAGVAAIALAAFGGLGRAMTGRQASWWLSLSAIPWLGIGVAVFVLAQTSRGWDPSVLWPYAAAGLAPAALALLSHGGPPRAIALLGILVAIVLLIAFGIQAKTQSDLVAGQQRLGSPVRPEVTAVKGYVPYGETQLQAPGTPSQALSWGYIKSGESTDGYPIQFVLITDQKTVAVCGAPLDARQLASDGQQISPEPETSCTKSGSRWSRTSANAHELSCIIDGKLVRAIAPHSTPVSVLWSALNNAKPMDDRYYRHLLLGERGQYIPELDGLR